MAKGFEGFGEYEYNDSGGTPTIGYGTTQHDPEAWKELIVNQPCSEERASKLAYTAFNKRYAQPIKDYVINNYKVDSQQKFDALTDLSYNAGPDRVMNQENSLPQALKRDPNNESYIRPIWEKYMITDGHTVQPGLIARRKAECDMYFHGKYEQRKISIVAKGTGKPTGRYVTANDGNGWLPDKC